METREEVIARRIQKRLDKSSVSFEAMKANEKRTEENKIRHAAEQRKQKEYNEFKAKQTAICNELTAKVNSILNTPNCSFTIAMESGVLDKCQIIISFNGEFDLDVLIAIKSVTKSMKIRACWTNYDNFGKDNDHLLIAATL